jgi:diguanylate cyclase (GGDEF)-like protein
MEWSSPKWRKKDEILLSDNEHSPDHRFTDGLTERTMNKSKLRELVRDMSADDIVNQMFYDAVSGLQNRRAFEISDDYTVVAIVDMDSLKWVNDNLGHIAGDTLLRKLGYNLYGTFGDHAYHLSGDEFAVTAESVIELSNKLRALQQAMQENLLSWPVSGGHFVDYTGAGAFSFGIGCNLSLADEMMIRDKEGRERLGHRAKRGETPDGVSYRRDAKLAELI